MLQWLRTRILADPVCSWSPIDPRCFAASATLRVDMARLKRERERERERVVQTRTDSPPRGHRPDRQIFVERLGVRCYLVPCVKLACLLSVLSSSPLSDAAPTPARKRSTRPATRATNGAVARRTKNAPAKTKSSPSASPTIRRECATHSTVRRRRPTSASRTAWASNPRTSALQIVFSTTPPMRPRRGGCSTRGLDSIRFTPRTRTLLGPPTMSGARCGGGVAVVDVASSTPSSSLDASSDPGGDWPSRALVFAAPHPRSVAPAIATAANSLASHLQPRASAPSARICATLRKVNAAADCAKGTWKRAGTCSRLPVKTHASTIRAPGQYVLVGQSMYGVERWKRKRCHQNLPTLPASAARRIA